jgi:hypothetical protein
MAIRLALVERVIVIAVPFVATLIFSPDTKPSAASHFPFSRMLGTMHSFLRCGWPHSRGKDMSDRVAGFLGLASDKHNGAPATPEPTAKGFLTLCIFV